MQQEIDGVVAFMVNVMLTKFMTNDVPHALGLVGGTVTTSLSAEDRERLVSQYGVWAVNLAQAVCPRGELACVEREARRLHQTREARRGL